LGRDVDYCPPSSVDINNGWRYNSGPLIRLYLNSVYRDRILYEVVKFSVNKKRSVNT